MARQDQDMDKMADLIEQMQKDRDDSKRLDLHRDDIADLQFKMEDMHKIMKAQKDLIEALQDEDRSDLIGVNGGNNDDDEDPDVLDARAKSKRDALQIDFGLPYDFSGIEDRTWKDLVPEHKPKHRNYLKRDDNFLGY